MKFSKNTRQNPNEGEETGKIYAFMHQSLEKMDKFKLATALQILLSRFNHPNERVRVTIQDVLSKLAVEYPG